MAAEVQTLRAELPPLTGDTAGPLLDFRLNGVAAFGGSPLDAAHALTGQMGALLKVLSAAHMDADAAEQGGAFGAESLATLQASVTARAFDGLHSLASLAAFFIEQHRRAQ